MRKKPNIVLFVPDSYRGDVLGHQGNAGAVTPNLDAIIDRDAVSYTNAFAQNPVCTPSRCSFMTGWYPHVHGHRSMRNMLKEYEPNLLTVLRNEGYYTWWGGKNDLVSLEKTEDYLKYCDEKFDSASKYIERMESYDSPLPLSPDDPRRGAMYSGVNFPGSVKQLDYDTACVLGAVDMIKNHSGENPFFCYLPLSKPHPPYYADEKFYNAIDPDKLPSRIPTPEDVNLSTILEALRTELRSDEITEEMWHEVKRVYYAMCSKIDDLFGKVVDALIEKGVYDDTWVFFFSDHGDFTGDYSLPEKTHATMQDCLVHVPLVVKPPKDVPVENGNRRHLVELLDVTATLYDMLEIDPGYAHQGISLRNSLSGDESVVHDAVFAEVGGRKGEEAFLNTQVYDFSPDNFYARQGKVAIPFHLAGSHAVMCRTLHHKYIRRYYTGCNELFDLEADPGETLNVSGDPEYAEIERDMEICLLDFFMRTCDTLPFEHDSRAI